MTTSTTGSRTLAIAAGALFTFGTMAILLEDILLHDAPLTLKHALTVITLAGTIMVGHLCHVAWRQRRRAGSLGFGVIFLAGTALVVYSSVGRQAESTIVTAAQAEAIVETRAGIKRQLTRSEAMLVQAQADLARECKTGKGRRCDGIKATVDVYEAAVKGHQADLTKMMPPAPVAPEAEQLASIAAVFGYDKAQVKAGSILLAPFLRTLFLEFGAIVCFGYGFRSRQETVSRVSTSKSTVSALDFTEAPKVSDKELEDLRRLLRSVGRPLNNNQIAELSGVVKSEASKRVQKAVDAGIVSKRRIGKEVAVMLN